MFGRRALRLRQLAALTLLSCLIIGLTACEEFLPPELIQVTPETAVPTRTLPAGAVSFRISPYADTIPQAGYVPGTQIRYLDFADPNYRLEVNGEETLRPPNNSLNWQGLIGPGVFADYALTLQAPTAAELRVSGIVDLTVLQAAPVVSDTPDPQSTPNLLYFEAVKVRTEVPVNVNVPGTTVAYRGQGVNNTVLLGSDQAPYEINDQWVWRGQVRDGVWVSYTLNVEGVAASGVILSGTADLWIRSGSSLP